MNEHIQDQIGAYLSGELDEHAAETVRTHLKICDACKKEFESLDAVWNSLGRIPDELPSARLHNRFYAALEAYESSLHTTPAPSAQYPRSLFEWLFPKQHAVQFAFMVLLVISGGIVGYLMRNGSTDHEQLNQLREEVRSVSRLLTVSLLQQESASERLQGVSWSYKLDNPDPEIMEVLFQTLRQDPNVNVRLAALDAISRNMKQPFVRDELPKTLTAQSSPMVQLAIIDLMVQLHEKESTEILKQLLQKPGINKAVRQRIEQGIQQLDS